MTTPNKTPPGADPKQLERTGKDGKLGHKLFGHSHLVNQVKQNRKKLFVLTTESFLVHWTDFNIRFV